jgi:chromosome segregation ATPase
MENITITVQGNELESINITLTQDEVTHIYKQYKELQGKVTALTKAAEDLKNTIKYREDSLNEKTKELSQAHTLMSALGVTEKTNEEESYYRKNLDIGTRIALYIATNKS